MYRREWLHTKIQSCCNIHNIVVTHINTNTFGTDEGTSISKIGAIYKTNRPTGVVTFTYEDTKISDSIAHNLGKLWLHLYKTESHWYRHFLKLSAESLKLLLDFSLRLSAFGLLDLLEFLLLEVVFNLFLQPALLLSLVFLLLVMLLIFVSSLPFLVLVLLLVAQLQLNLAFTALNKCIHQSVCHIMYTQWAVTVKVHVKNALHAFSVTTTVTVVSTVVVLVRVIVTVMVVTVMDSWP
jgi:hypothetical protein